MKWFVLWLLDESANDFLNGFLATGLERRGDGHRVELGAGDLAEAFQGRPDSLQVGATEPLRNVKRTAVERYHSSARWVLCKRKNEARGGSDIDVGNRCGCVGRGNVSGGDEADGRRKSGVRIPVVAHNRRDDDFAGAHAVKRLNGLCERRLASEQLGERGENERCKRNGFHSVMSGEGDAQTRATARH